MAGVVLPDQRLAVHARMRFFGSHDWYLEGAKNLMKAQAADGALAELTTDHCGAMLFLMRASSPAIAPALKESDGAAGK